MMYVTLGVVALLILLAIAALVFGDVLSELTNFMYIVLAVIILIIGAALYLSIAVPSFAHMSVFDSGKDEPHITQDNVQGLNLTEE
jgi:cytochrome c biogenesis protein CcdA